MRALVLLEGVPIELPPAAAEWTRAIGDRIREVAAQAGTNAALLYSRAKTSGDPARAQLFGLRSAHRGPDPLLRLTVVPVT